MAPQHLFNAQKLVVFGQTIRATQGTGLDLPSIGRYSDVNGRILGFTRAMADDRVTVVSSTASRVSVRPILSLDGITTPR